MRKQVLTINTLYMKRILRVACAAAIILFAYSTAYGQINFGFKGGLNLSNVAFHTPVDNAPKVLPTFQAGGVVEWTLRDYLALGTGIQLQSKGYQYKTSDDNYFIQHTVNPLYVQVPVQVIFHGGGVFGSFGPFAGFGVSGGSHKVQYTPRSSDGAARTQRSALRYGNGLDDDITPFEFGGMVEFGYESKIGLRFTFTYQAGLSDWRPADRRDLLLDSKTASRVASFCVTYMFGVK